MISRCVRDISTETVTIGGEAWIASNEKHTAQILKPLPVVLTKGKGVWVWDTAGTKYLDFLAGFGSVNQGHTHPHIAAAMHEQAQILTLTSRAFHSDAFIEFIEILHETFGFDKCIMMNTGCEAVETAVKLARRWAYITKGVPDNQAKVIWCNKNFWGRSIAACASSDAPARYANFGPYGDLGFELIDYNDTTQLEEAFQDPNVGGFVLEPIQGEGGVVIPHDGYLQKVRDLCDQYNVLMVADEVQTGLGRTGKMLATEYENVRPDILTLGKSISGGFMPVSVALADNAIMDLIKPGEHGSTFGGCPMASRVAKAALEVIRDEGLVENSFKMGEVLRSELADMDYPVLQSFRGRGLMNALVIDESLGRTAGDICMQLAKEGLLCKQTAGNVIRLTPPLIISESEMAQGIDILRKVLAQYKI